MHFTACLSAIIAIFSGRPVWAQSPQPVPLVLSETQEEEKTLVEMETRHRWKQIFPSNWGHAGIFRVRSAESLPPKTLTFGIGGEFYSISNGPALSGNTDANTISEQLFVGYSFSEHLTVGLVRRNSSTTFGSPQKLISSLGDFNLSGMYQIPLTPVAAIAPIANVMVASNFNDLIASENTLSAGFGAAFSILLGNLINIPLSAHANILYHMPQIRTDGDSTLAPEIYFNFSRFHTLTSAVGAELQWGDFIPFVELHQTAQLSSAVSWANSPSRLSLGTRITPINNKGLAVLLGADIGLGQGVAAGVPFNPGYQIIGQVSYTVGLGNSERAHYFSTKDVSVIDRKFVIGKDINFKVGRAELEPDSYEVLDQIADTIERNQISKLLIVGHTDSSHTNEYNLKLSNDRANSVRNYLTSKNIAQDVLIAQGYGKRKPKASNLTAEGRAQNRRVEFLIIE